MRFLPLVLCRFLSPSPPPVAAIPTGEPYVIDSFHATIDIAKNGNVRVLEEIRVSFYESRRGIFRVIPTSYDTGGPTRRDILLTDVRVTDDAGNKLTTLVTREGANLKIRIGDEDVWLSPGTQKSYLISYRTENVLNFFGPNAGDWGIRLSSIGTSPATNGTPQS